MARGIGRWKRAALALLALPALGFASALAAVPTAAQKQEFYRTCLAISGNETLCTCKADAAMSLIDQRFMGVVIASMQGGSPASADYDAYNTYVARSNQVCKPDY